ncbi:MAG: hypothetical protein OEL89_04975, partial [Candidatus Peregrinibacteria bacterium]|nr:hypothetical protein [Candidatus Peregrinibacteria bacterium]
LTYYKYTPGAPGSWGAVGTIAEGKTNYFDIGGLGGNDNPIDITFDGTYFYVLDSVDAYVYKYNAALDTLVDSFDIGALGGNDDPSGICWDGTYFYVLDSVDAYVYKYNAALDTLVDSFDIGALGGNDYPIGITFDGTYFYVVDFWDQYVYKYNAALDTLVDSFDIGALGGNDYPIGITFDGTYFYVVDLVDAHIYKYNTDFSTILKRFDIGALGGNDDPSGIYWDDSFFYVIDLSDVYIYKYHSDLITELGLILYTAIISNNVYLVYQYITGDCKVYVKDLDDSSNPVLLETITSGLIIPYLDDQRGISVSSDNDVLSFVLKDISDGLTYFCTYAISTDTFTKRGKYNVALMLDRNTDATNDPPFNLEKGFHLTSLYLYQIPKTYLGRLWKISDLSNDPDFSGFTIKAITDTYLIVEGSGSTILASFQDVSDYILEGEIYHAERDYPTATMVYRSDKYFIEQDMFVQVIGPVRINGVTSSTGIQFEGYVLKPEDWDEESVNYKIVDLVNPSKYDLVKSFSGNLEEGSGDDWLDTIDDSFNYTQKGTYDSGSLTLPKIRKDSEKSNALFIDQLAVGEEFTWRIRPTGELDWTDGTDDSGLNYDQDTPIWDVKISKKEIRPNQITVSGGYFGGVQISSESDHGINSESQLINEVIEEGFTISWIPTVALANSYADAIVNKVGATYIEINFQVRDTTNGFIPSGEEITLEYTHKSITSAQYKINQVVYDFKNSISEYIVSSIVRWDALDLKRGFENELSDQVSQVNERTAIKTGWDANVDYD